MNYRIFNNENKQISGSAFFHIGNYIVSFGKSENGNVSAKCKITSKKHVFKDMEGFFFFYQSEKEKSLKNDDF